MTGSTEAKIRKKKWNGLWGGDGWRLWVVGGVVGSVPPS